MIENLTGIILWSIRQNRTGSKSDYRKEYRTGNIRARKKCKNSNAK